MTKWINMGIAILNVAIEAVQEAIKLVTIPLRILQGWHDTLQKELDDLKMQQK